MWAVIVWYVEDVCSGWDGSRRLLLMQASMGVLARFDRSHEFVAPGQVGRYAEE